MLTQMLGPTGLEVSRIGLGMMRIAQMDQRQIRELLAVARDAGVTLFDHADIYGGQLHGSEQQFGRAISWSPSEREQVVVQSKVGIADGYYDSSKEHIVTRVEESLAALRLDYLDILLLHRPDTLVEPQEVAEAFDDLYAAGKVRHFGVSNHTPAQIELLRTAVRHPLVVNQMQWSLTHAALVSSGLAANVGGEPASPSLDGSLLEFARRENITLQAWAPFQNPQGGGTFIGDHDRYPQLNEVLQQLADQYQLTPTGVAAAWIARHPAQVQTIAGTTNPARLREIAAGAQVRLTRPEWYRLYRAAGHPLP